MVSIAASVLSADILLLGNQIREAESAGADAFHVDIMDGVFVPSLSFGPVMVTAVCRSSKLPVRAHLMVAEPAQLIDECIESGAACVTVHAEVLPHLHRLITRIKGKGAKAGVAINPATPIESVRWVLPDLDSVTVMTVNPGFAGQTFIQSLLPKIRQLRHLVNELNLNTDIVVDGGINHATAKDAVLAGATTLVAGSYLFGSDDMKRAIALIKHC